MGVKNGIEFKINPQNHPFLRIQLELGAKTMVTKQSILKLLSWKPASSSTEAIEFMFKFEADKLVEVGEKTCSDAYDLISEFKESNQIRVCVRKVPVGGKNLRHLSAIQTKYISSHTNGTSLSSSSVKVKKEKEK